MKGGAKHRISRLVGMGMVRPAGSSGGDGGLVETSAGSELEELGYQSDELVVLIPVGNYGDGDGDNADDATCTPGPFPPVQGYSVIVEI